MTEGERPPLRGRITVLAGVNGAGKSSVAGAALRERGADYWNPDEVTRTLLVESPGETLESANARGWRMGVEHLRVAATSDRSFVFETTLGGRTITELLLAAAERGKEIDLLFVGLDSVEMHIDRVRERVRRGGHDIPEERIRARHRSSRENLLRLLPHLRRFRLVDNSAPPGKDGTVRPREILRRDAGGPFLLALPLREVPGWARPLVERAFELSAPSAAPCPSPSPSPVPSALPAAKERTPSR